MPFDDLNFWHGAAGAGITGFFGLWLRKITKRESLEERLQRWQESTVARVQEENSGLRGEIATLKERSSRVPVMEACLRLAIDALHRIAPESPELRQIGVLLERALPVDPTTPHDMQELLDRIRPKGGNRRAKR